MRGLGQSVSRIEGQDQGAGSRIGLCTVHGSGAPGAPRAPKTLTLRVLGAPGAPGAPIAPFAP